MNILQLIDSRDDESKLTRIMKFLKAQHLFKCNIDVLCQKFVISRRQLLNYVSRLPYFLKDNKDIKLRCKPMTRYDVPWVKSCIDTCESAKELCFTYLYIYGEDRDYNSLLSLEHEVEVTRNTFHENKKLYKLWFELIN